MTPEERLAQFEATYAKYTDTSHRAVVDHINGLAFAIHRDMLAAGFWEDIQTVMSTMAEKGLPIEQYIIQSRIALIMSELGEAVEGSRKNKQDEHLPQFDSLTVELADAVIRILDLAEGFDRPIAEAIVAKCEYNMTRPYKHGKNS